jgi:haloacetate dehalogenase
VFDGFEIRMIDTGDARIFTRYGGAGPAILLLHGHPRTSATWHRVAPQLVQAGFTVVAPDLRGYGRSIGPAPVADHSAHSKRAVANDMISVMHQLGHERFFVVGHDRGSYVGLRLALDRPELVVRMALLDCIPIVEHLDRIDTAFATKWWHWFFFAQPETPERVILADPDAWYHGDPTAMGQQNYDEWRAATRRPEVVTAMLEDYRAGLTLDRDAEQADRDGRNKVIPPLLVLWSLRDDLEALVGDPVAIWRSWAGTVSGHGIDSGHHMAEDAPDELSGALIDFFSEPGSSLLR